MAHEIDWDNRRFTAKFTGHVTGADIEQVNAIFSGDSRFETVQNALWDMTGVTGLNLPDLDLEMAVAMDKGASQVRPMLKGAMVATHPEVCAQIEKYLALSREVENDWDTRLFNDLKSANDWLSS